MGSSSKLVHSELPILSFCLMTQNVLVQCNLVYMVRFRVLLLLIIVIFVHCISAKSYFHGSI